MNLCGLDVGTTGVKAIVFDETGTQKSASYRAYDIGVAQDGTRLLKGIEIWAKVKEALTEAAAKSGGRLDAICPDSFGEAFVVMDKDDQIICDPMLYTDRWGEDEYFEAEKKTNALEIAEICGLPLSPTYSLSKVLYLKQRRPEIYENAHRILLIEDFINYMLCGRAAVDYSVACRTMFFDVRECEWSDKLIDKFGLDKQHYSEPVPTGSIIGDLSAAVAAETGIGGSCKIIAGGHDQPVNMIGAGLRPGYVVDSMGTTESLTPLMDSLMSPQTIVDNHLPAEPVWQKGRYCSMAYNPTSGLLVQWFFKTFSDTPEPPYALFEKNFPQKPTKIMVQPYLMGSGTPYFDHSARLAFTGIDYGVTRYDLYRATLEGLAMDQRLNIGIMKGLGLDVNGLTCVGGGSKSKPWLKVKADILQIPMNTITVGEAGALGCAMIAAYATGVYSSIEEAAQTMSHIKDTVEPDPTYAEFYSEKFELYRELNAHVKQESRFALKEI